jgi:hypothetical protein
MKLTASVRNIPVNKANSDTLAEGIEAIPGSRNIVLVAPHGNMKDDMGTSEFTQAVREHLDCYAVINTRFRKGVEPDLKNNIADLYKSEGFLHPRLKTVFYDPLTVFLDQILASHDKALIIHIHGIKDGNIEKIAELGNGDPSHKNKDLRLVIGYGQHFKNPRPTASENDVVLPMIEAFTRNGLGAQAAPTLPISNGGHKTWYCGNDRQRMNQYLYSRPRYQNKLQSLQIELKYTGVRDHEGSPRASRNFAAAVRAIWSR